MNERPSFVVMTYNVGNGLVRPARLVAFLRESGADVVGLQEVDETQAAAVAAGASDVYPHQVVRGSGFAGRGLLSRYPIVDREWLDLVPDRPDLRASLLIAGVAIAVFVVHPSPPRAGRRGVVFDPVTRVQLDRLTELVAGAAPAILLGDLNMTARHPSYARLVAAGLVDAYRAAGPGRGATFPARPGRMQRVNHRLTWMPLPPVARVDYIWHTPDLVTLGARVAGAAGSDHRPVLARLALPGDRPG